MPEMSISSGSSVSVESYPPVFRQLKAADGVTVTPSTNSTKTQNSSTAAPAIVIPMVDLQCLSQSQEQEQEQDRLGEASKEWGLFRLVNHGIPATLLTQLEEHAKMLFGLSFESKQALLTSPLSYFWGTPVLTPSGDALRGALNINWVEGLNVPLPQLPHCQAQHPVLDSFRLLLEEYGKHLMRIATTLFEAMAKNLRLSPKQTESKLAESTGFIRVYRYPPAGSMADEGWGMIAHTDSSVLSIVNQDQVGGLEIFKDNEWLLVNPIPNTLIVHIGDMMQAISDDEYISVKHRVRVNQQEERFSICYFIFPEEGSVIRSSKYRPFTYADFQEQVQKDTKTLGYKVGLERFKLTSNVDG